MVTNIPLRSSIVALIAIAFSAADSWAARSSGARLTIADNKVSVAGQPVSSGTTIALGDTITTGSRSHAELTLPNGTVVRIGQGSSFTYSGSKLVLNQGTALVHATHKGTTVVSGSRSYTGGPAVVSAEVSKKTDGLYILQGGGKVNGVTLIPGQTSVLDRGKDRTFTFDLQKMVGSSALVTKFPQTPWVSQTQALAAVQHQLLTAKVTPAGKPGAPVASQDIVSSKAANLVSTGAAGRSFAGRPGSPGSPVGGALQLLSGPLSLGADKVAVIKSAAISSFTNGGTLRVSGATTTAAATLTIAGSIINVGASTLVFDGSDVNSIASTRSLTKAGAGTLNLGTVNNFSGATLTDGRATGATLNTGGALAITASNLSSNFLLNAGVTGLNAATITGVNPGGGALTIANGNGGVLTATPGGAILGGANTFNGGTTLNAGTLNLTNSFSGTLSVTGGTLVLTNPNLTVANIGTINPAATITYATGGNILFGGATLPQQVGQTVTINGVNYISTLGTGATGTLNLQPVAH